MTISKLIPGTPATRDIFFKGNILKTKAGEAADYVVLVSDQQGVGSYSFAGVVIGGKHTIGFTSDGFIKDCFEQYYGVVKLETEA